MCASMSDASPLPRIYLVRHGETEWSRLGKHTGKTDLPLLPQGEVDAQRVRPRLEKLTLETVISSPRLRARRTCELAGLLGRATIDDDVAEWDYGNYEGLTAEEIAAGRPGWSIYRDGCPGGESAEEITVRADRVVARLSRMSGNVAVFSHGHFLRILTARWLGWPIASAQNLLLSTASLSILGFNHGRRERPVIILWNETQT
jgi:broad specificity phosphatase PhoE